MREASFWRIFWRQVWPFLTLILLLASAGLLVAGAVIWHEEQKYATDGGQAAAQVTEKYSRKSGKSGRSYRIRYQFKTEDGRPYAGEDRIAQAVWQAMQEGDSVAVQYVKSAPQTNRIARAEKAVAPLVLTGLGGVGAAAALFFFVRSMRRVLALLHIWREGRDADATVTEVKQTWVTVNNRRQWRIHYEYLDLAGRKFQGESEYVPPQEASAWKAGDRVAIRYDKDQPELSVWVGKAT